MSGGPWEDYAPLRGAATPTEGAPWADYGQPASAPDRAPRRGFTLPSLSSVVNGVLGGATETGQQIVDAAVSGATLPRDAYQGKVETTPTRMTREEGMRVADLASLASPISPASRAAQAVPVAAPRVANEAADAGITLTAGQRTGDPALLSTENAMAGGAKGAEAQRIAQDAVARQGEQIAAAKQAVGETAGRGQADLTRPADAGDVVTQAVRREAADAKAEVGRRYDVVRDTPGALDTRFFTGAAKPGANEVAVPGSALAEVSAPLSKRITESLVNRTDPVIIDQTLTPAAHRALGELDAVTNLRLGSIGQPGANDVVAGVTLRGVDQARRKLAAYGRAAKGNPTDQRAVGSIIGEFDAQVQSAMESGLFSGSDDALVALKDARSAFASYQRTFKPQGGGDDVGTALRAILERDATPEQVANYLFGASKVGASGQSVRLADRLRTIVGEQSPEWAAIRQGAWQRVMGAADMGVKRSSDRILDFLEGDGKSLATRLFSEAERGEMRRLANVLRAISTRPGTVNPSNSGNRLGALARESFAALASMLGASTGGVPGAAAGYVAGRGAAALSNARGAAQARQLFSGEAPVSIARRIAQSQEGAGLLAAPRLGLPPGQAALPGSLGNVPRLQGPAVPRAEDEQD